MLYRRYIDNANLEMLMLKSRKETGRDATTAGPAQRAAFPLVMLVGILLITVSAAYAAVDLAYFTGEWDSDEVTLEWQTGSEGDTLGFFVWRSEEDLQLSSGNLDTSRATRLNASNPIVNPDGPCNALNSHTYTFTDETAAEGETYYYFLENRNCGSGGDSDFYGEDGNDTGSGVRVGDAAAPTATRTNTPVRTATRTNTPVPSATTTEDDDDDAQATNTPVASATDTANNTQATPTTRPSNTPAPSATPRPATSATATTGSSSTNAAPTATVRPSNTPLPQPTNAPLTEQSNPTTQDDSAGAAESSAASTEQSTEENDPPVAAENDLLPTATVEIALDTNNPAPGGSSEGGVMSEQSAAATPTIGSILGSQQSPQGEELFANESSSDGADRLIQGVIGLVLLVVAALAGWLGWTYVQKPQ